MTDSAGIRRWGLLWNRSSVLVQQIQPLNLTCSVNQASFVWEVRFFWGGGIGPKTRDKRNSAHAGGEFSLRPKKLGKPGRLLPPASEKFRNLAPDWSATLDLAPNSTPLQNLAPRPRIVSKNRQHLIFYCFSPFCHCFL
jgi:hypothetical protein